MATASPSTQNRLVAIRTVHTLVWAFFAACIIAIPVFAYQGRFGWSAGLSIVVLIEVLVLAANDWRCPLTDVAARHTDDRRDNFDIYLPRLVARHNKSIFGSLYVAGLFYTGGKWAGWLP